MRTRNGGGSGWCGSVFSKFHAQLSCCVSSGFTDFRSTFENFTPLVFILGQIFQAIRGDTKGFHGDLLWVFVELFLIYLGALALRQFVVDQFIREAVIFHAVTWCPTETIEIRLILFPVFELTVASHQRVTVKKEYGSQGRPDVYTWWPHSGCLTWEGRSQMIGWDPKTEVGTPSRQRK